MSTPRFYSWDDDGSPGRALSGNLQNKLKQILVPCLVTGYGSKPGAGWTLEHEHANGFTLSNGDAYVNFVSNLPASAQYPAMQNYCVQVYVAESLINTSEAIIDGANLCSGPFFKDGPSSSNTNRHLLLMVDTLQLQLSSLQWTLVADEETFILSCSVNNDQTPQWFSFVLYVGSAIIDSGISAKFVALGGGIGAFEGGVPNSAFCNGFTAPRNLKTGVLGYVPTGALPYLDSSDINPLGIATTNPAYLQLQQPRLTAGNDFVGRLRGVVYDDALRGSYGWKTHLSVLGLNSNDYTKRGVPVKIGDYSYAFARSLGGNAILTDNPAFW